MNRKERRVAQAQDKNEAVIRLNNALYTIPEANKLAIQALNRSDAGARLSKGRD